MKISNGGQLTAKYNRRCELSFPTNRPNDDVIHKECNKPLRSKCWVDSRQIGNIEPYYHRTTDYTVRKSGGLWLVYDKPKKVHSDIVKEQQKLYNKLKREYENSLIGNTDIVETELTREDKLKAKTRKQTINMISGLAFAPRYDRIYANS